MLQPSPPSAVPRDIVYRRSNPGISNDLGELALMMDHDLSWTVRISWLLS